MARIERHNDGAAGPAAGATPALIRWGAVAGGGVIGLSLLVLLTALWLALAFGTGVASVEANFDWFVAISAIFAMFVGGVLAGWLAGVPGFAPGMFNGLTVWGVVLTVSLLVGTPGMLQTVGTPDQAVIGALGTQTLWAGFIAMVIGAVSAALGGGLGGAITRPAFVYAAPEPVDRPAVRTVETERFDPPPRVEERRTEELRTREPEPTAEHSPRGDGGRERRVPESEEAAPNGGAVGHRR